MNCKLLPHWGPRVSEDPITNCQRLGFVGFCEELTGHAILITIFPGSQRQRVWFRVKSLGVEGFRDSGLILLP